MFLFLRIEGQMNALLQRKYDFKTNPFIETTSILINYENFSETALSFSRTFNEA